MPQVEVRVPPRGKARPPASIVKRTKGKGPVCPWCRRGLGLHFRIDDATEALEKAVARDVGAVIEPCGELVAPVELYALAVHQRPQNRFRQCDDDGLGIVSNTRFDVDNIAKAVGDGVQRCRICLKTTRGRDRCRCRHGPMPVLDDDRQVGRLIVEQSYAEILDRRSRSQRCSRLIVSVESLIRGSPPMGPTVSF